MNLAVVGTGYVGLVSAACFADLGHTVTGIDIDEEKIAKLKQGICTIYEPGLEEVLQRGLKSGRLKFTTDLESVLNDHSVVFSAVATPPQEDFSADLKAVFTVCKTVAKYAERDMVFVNKSTVPVGTGRDCETLINKELMERGKDLHIPVISNPEFLREGTAVQDTMQPDRIVVGINKDNWATELIDELYAPLTRVGKPLIHMSRESAELVKYASNAFLANKISFINMMSEFCETVGADVRDIAVGMGLDERIGSRFLHAGIGFGGSCFPKDVKALIAMSRHYNVPLPLIDSVHDINLRQRQRFFQKLLNTIKDNSTIGIWGLSFKPKTDDMREAPSIDLIPMLLDNGHKVKVYDPVAMEDAPQWLPEGVEYCSGAMEAAADTDAVILLTEWDVFRGINMHELKKIMKGHHIFDGRNVYDPDEVSGAELEYHGIGIG